MGWWNQLGSMYMGLNDYPALAVDLSTNGPRGDFGYTLAGLLNSTPTPLNVYPPEEPAWDSATG